MLSLEGSAQGDPLAMAMYMYALSLQPLIIHLDSLAHRVWCADAAAGAESLTEVKHGGMKLLLLSPLLVMMLTPTIL